MKKRAAGGADRWRELRDITYWKNSIAGAETKPQPGFDRPDPILAVYITRKKVLPHDP